MFIITTVVHQCSIDERKGRESVFFFTWFVQESLFFASDMKKRHFYSFNQCSFLVVFDRGVFVCFVFNVVTLQRCDKCFLLFSVRHKRDCMRNLEGNALILVFALTNLTCLLKCECKCTMIGSIVD